MRASVLRLMHVPPLCEAYFWLCWGVQLKTPPPPLYKLHKHFLCSLPI